MKILRPIGLAMLVLLPLPTYNPSVSSRTVSQSTDSNHNVLIHNGFFTGQDFRELPELEKRYYSAGLVDGLFLAPLFHAPKAKIQWLENCVEGMSTEQVAAIISKYLNDNPVRWHERVHVLAYSALLQSCPGAPK